MFIYLLWLQELVKLVRKRRKDFRCIDPTNNQREHTASETKPFKTIARRQASVSPRPTRENPPQSIYQTLVPGKCVL